MNVDATWVAVAATVGRGTLATAGIAFVVLLIVLPVAGMAHGVGPWLPTRLLTAPGELVMGAAVHEYLRAVLVAVAAAAALLLVAVRRAGKREF